MISVRPLSSVQIKPQAASLNDRSPAANSPSWVFGGFNESGNDFAVAHVFVVGIATVGIQSQPVSQLIMLVAQYSEA
jgi:hypothetical protein